MAPGGGDPARAEGEFDMAPSCGRVTERMDGPTIDVDATP